MGNVSDYFAAAHERLERQVAWLARLFEAGELQPAQREAALVAAEVMQHLEEEERDIFPLLAARLLLAPRIVAFAREHRVIAAQLVDLCEAADDGELVIARQEAEDLLVLLEAHHRREMQELYCWADVVLPPGERARLIRAGEAA
jgi:hypothetical protein